MSSSPTETIGLSIFSLSGSGDAARAGARIGDVDRGVGDRIGNSAAGSCTAGRLLTVGGCEHQEEPSLSM